MTRARVLVVSLLLTVACLKERPQPQPKCGVPPPFVQVSAAMTSAGSQKFLAAVDRDGRVWTMTIYIGAGCWKQWPGAAE